MATQFFLHDAASANQSANLPAAKKSSLSTTVNVISQATNKSMNASAGVSEVTQSGSATGANVSWYICRWVSDLCINQSSIGVDTWTFGNAAKNDGTSTFPVNQDTLNKQYICIYVWRPSNQTVVGKIFDGETSTASNNPGNVETTSITSVSGSAVNGITQNDVLCVEWLADNTLMAVGGTGNIYYDGTDTTFGSGNALTDIGSYISWTTNIAFTAFTPPIPTVGQYFKPTLFIRNG